MLTVGNITIPGHKVGPSSWYPAIRTLIKSTISSRLDENDGLFIGYGMFNDVLPYTIQDDYCNAEVQLHFQAVTLENRYLKAVFLPELGGRLWSIYDKEHQRDLILKNSAFIPCNLAIRNAWFAGGVEFNCGRYGHDEQTCSPRFAAIVKQGKYEALRIYEYQRDRGTPFQYDCFLPDDSRFLFIRTRIYNPNDYLVPMYWWSNIAMPELEGTRVVVPTDNTFANWYQNGSHALSKLSLPDGEGFDGTYPVNFQYVKDHFYNIPEEVQPYECLFYPDGYGFCHTSTKRLRGRKLFVWGQCQGGRHWNRKLLGPGENDAYIEVQAGLGRTQQECLPMPPKSAWEWIEAYGSIQVKPKSVFGSWDKARECAAKRVAKEMPLAKLDMLLKETHDALALQPGKVICAGSGWGALEEMRTGHKLAEQLDFGKPTPLQKPWVELLKKHTITAAHPDSYLVSDEWFALLKKAKPSWQVHYHLALNYIRRNDLERAETELLQAFALDCNDHLLHAMANLRLRQNKPDSAAALIREAALRLLNDTSFIKESLKMLLSVEHYRDMLKIISQLPETVAEEPLVQMMKAAALAHTGKLNEAEKILLQNGGLDIPDIREGENSTSELYLYIKEQQALRKHQPFDKESCPVPFILDLRMQK